MTQAEIDAKGSEIENYIDRVTAYWTEEGVRYEDRYLRIEYSKTKTWTIELKWLPQHWCTTEVFVSYKGVFQVLRNGKWIEYLKNLAFLADAEERACSDEPFLPVDDSSLFGETPVIG